VILENAFLGEIGRDESRQVEIGRVEEWLRLGLSGAISTGGGG